ncbi:hypothetical protein [Methylopila sp. Yamaguchi]|uniref:hypothetical protein n=1 Tax=Methylopila sp. Yamaguchi TaxID=1437817 RepID=UPI000CAA258F|nr:hypothetical protein [Methylopila sp. Yamaguchi]GBD47587.1 hypothetical protein METY_0800 [Methylopila sp. Yamaguchi]
MLYVSFGVEKGGSTYTYILIRTALEAAGHAHVQVDLEGRPVNDDSLRSERVRRRAVNNINVWNEDVLAAVSAAVPQEALVALRTHGEPDPAVLEAIDSGRAYLGVGVRDPRDLALSMLDVATQRIGLAHRPHWLRIEPGDLASALPAVQRTVDRALKWVRPGATVFYYEETAFRPRLTLDRFCRQTGLPLFTDEAAEKIVATASASPHGKRNVAAPLRHTREMNADDQKRVLDHFSSFYDRFFPGADVALA